VVDSYLTPSGVPERIHHGGHGVTECFLQTFSVIFVSSVVHSIHAAEIGCHAVVEVDGRISIEPKNPKLRVLRVLRGE
jgi:hypothetical protein